MSLSGADAADLIDGHEKFSVVQSGTQQFMFLKTKSTPDRIDFNSTEYAGNIRLGQYIESGWSHSEGSKRVARELAKQYNLAYYEGSNGVLSRVYP